MPKYPKITNRKIKYNSPSGYINIGKYIPPFEKVGNGYGFKGILAEDVKSGKLQCHICGMWLERFNIHLQSKHGINTAEYKKKFGLLKSTALISKNLRVNASKVMQKLREKNKSNRYKFKKNNPFASNRKANKKPDEHRNKFGVCDLQLAHKIKEIYDRDKKTPTLTRLQEVYGAHFVTLLNQRYGSYVKLCKDLGYSPNISNHNPKYSRDYFIKKGLSEEPALRILTKNEARAFYKHFKSTKEWKKEVLKNEARIK